MFTASVQLILPFYLQRLFTTVEVLLFPWWRFYYCYDNSKMPKAVKTFQRMWKAIFQMYQRTEPLRKPWCNSCVAPLSSESPLPTGKRIALKGR